MTRWPAINTPVGGQRHMTGGIYAGLLALMLIVVPAIGFLLALAASMFADNLKGNGPISLLYMIGLFVGFSPVFS